MLPLWWNKNTFLIHTSTTNPIYNEAGLFYIHESPTGLHDESEREYRISTVQ